MLLNKFSLFNVGSFFFFKAHLNNRNYASHDWILFSTFLFITTHGQKIKMSIPYCGKWYFHEKILRNTYKHIKSFVLFISYFEFNFWYPISGWLSPNAVGAFFSHIQVRNLIESCEEQHQGQNIIPRQSFPVNILFAILTKWKRLAYQY